MEIDPRTRKTIYPVRVVTTQGDVTGSEALTEVRPVQISLNETGTMCVLKNGAEGTHAAVLVDFGRELHGTVALSVASVKNAAGTKWADVRVRLGESVGEAMTPLGERGTTNDHAQRDGVLSVAVLSDNQTPESGFRFAWVELLTPNAGIMLRAVTAVFIFRDLPYLGSFECSDDRLNEIWKTSAYTVHLNMQRYLWDGIKRDRLVWAGDMNTEIQTILAVFGGDCDVVTRSLDFARDTTPAGEPMCRIASYSLWWIISHFDWYMATGDFGYLCAQKDYMEQVLEKYFAYIGDDGSEHLPGNPCFFDWPNRSCKETTHAGLQGLFRYALLRASVLMNYLGNRSLSVRCREAADKLLAHMPDPMGRKQPAAMLALAGFGDKRRLVEDVILPGGARDLSTFLGYFTLVACGRSGHTADALDIIRDYWGTMLDMGATTFWEDFNVEWAQDAARIDELPVPGKKDIHGDFGAFCYEKYRHSLCHGWASGPAPFLSKYVLGIRPFTPGFDYACVKPELAGLKWARGSVPTPHGPITVEAEGEKVKIGLPDGVKLRRTEW